LRHTSEDKITNIAVPKNYKGLGAKENEGMLLDYSIFKHLLPFRPRNNSSQIILLTNFMLPINPIQIIILFIFLWHLKK
jgi:hypothetical protein